MILLIVDVSGTADQLTSTKQLLTDFVNMYSKNSNYYSLATADGVNLVDNATATAALTLINGLSINTNSINMNKYVL